MGEMIRPVYVDGPVAGIDWPVDLDRLPVSRTITVDLPAAPGGRPRPAQYHLRRFGFTCAGDRVEFWVAATTVLDPPASALVEHLFSPAAKAAQITEAQ